MDITNFINGLITWLDGAFTNLLERFYNIAIDFIQAIIDAIPAFILSLVQLFGYACPPPPLMAVPSSGTSSAIFAFILTCINWLFPMSFLVLMVQFLMCAMTGYFACMVVFRWVKAST